MNSTTEDMKTPASCINKLVGEGYTLNFRVVENGMTDDHSDHIYTPEEVEITDFYRFEGASDPDENSILYAIRTMDGKKGTITDAYGTYADPTVTRFIKLIEEISKKAPRDDEKKS